MCVCVCVCVCIYIYIYICISVTFMNIYVQEHRKKTKTLLHHQVTAMFYKANQMSLELHKYYMFTIMISQNIYRMIKNFIQQTIQQTFTSSS